MSLTDKFKEFTNDGEIDVFQYDDSYRVEFRVSFNGKVREDTRSSVKVNSAKDAVTQSIIRLPKTNGDETELQNQMIMIGRRIFGDQIGCYVRKTGRIHIKYPASGTIPGYPIETFISDLRKFISEIESRNIV